jgi:hypothetical protein
VVDGAGAFPHLVATLFFAIYIRAQLAQQNTFQQWKRICHLVC